MEVLHPIRAQRRVPELVELYCKALGQKQLQLVRVCNTSDRHLGLAHGIEAARLARLESERGRRNKRLCAPPERALVARRRCLRCMRWGCARACSAAVGLVQARPRLESTPDGFAKVQPK